MAAAYALGVAEGIVSCEQVFDFAYNVLTSSFGQGPNAGPSSDLLSFIDSNDAWVKAQVSSLAETDDYWLAVGQVMATMDGILEGVNAFSSCKSSPDFQPLTRLDLLLVNMDGDLFDLTVAYPNEKGPDRPRANPTSTTTGGGGDPGPAAAVAAGGAGAEARRRFHLRHEPQTTRDAPTSELRCSALFKLLEDGSDVFFGHDTWDTYATAAPRIFKTVTLPVRRGSSLETHTDSFSSSPGFVASVDDYYVLGGTSKLTVIETSNEVYNTSVYAESLTPESVLSWVRTMASNMLASDGSTWSDLFAKYHSGTYNNQWMLLDASKFDPPASSSSSSARAGADAPAAAEGQEEEGLFWVLEEAPGLIHAEDLTSTLLGNGYWASYNVAFFEDVRERLGDTQSFDSCPRANLFREMQSGVVDLPSMQKLMGWNDYLNDPNSLGQPSNAIMARDDLFDPVGFAAGGIDSKCSSIRLSRAAAAAAAPTASARAEEEGEVEEGEDPLTTFARAGPTHDSLPPFCWGNSTVMDLTPHQGHPACFAYEWARIPRAV